MASAVVEEVAAAALAMMAVVTEARALGPPLASRVAPVSSDERPLVSVVATAAASSP